MYLWVCICVSCVFMGMRMCKVCMGMRMCKVCMGGGVCRVGMGVLGYTCLFGGVG